MEGQDFDVLGVELKVVGFERYEQTIDKAFRKTLDFKKLADGINPTFAGGFDKNFQSVEQSSRKAFDSMKRLDTLQKQLFSHAPRDPFAAVNKSLSLTEKQLAAVEKRFDTINSKSGAFAGNLSQGLAAGLNIPLGTAAVTTASVAGLNDAIKKSLDLERAQRELSASATKAGLSVQSLNREAQEFRIESGLTEAESKRLSGQFARLAQAAGRPQDLDKIQTAALDLASARGVQVRELEPFINALITGSSDEPLNRFGLADPGKLKDDYAKSLNKTTEALSAQEEVLSRYNPFLKQAGIYTDANADRMKSLSGQMETAGARLSDLSTNFGTALTSNLAFRDAISTTTDLLKAMSLSVDDVQAKLAKGVSPKDIATEEAKHPINKTVNALKTAFSVIPATLAYPYDVVKNGFADANRQYLEAMQGTERRFIDKLTAQLEGEAKNVEKQNRAAVNQAIENYAKNIRDQQKAAEGGLNKELSFLKETATSFAEIDAYRKKFKDSAYLFNFEDYQKQIKGQGELEAKILNRNFDKILNAGDGQLSLDKFAKTIDLFKQRKQNLLPDDLFDAEKKINSLSESLEKTADNLRDFSAAQKSVDNPLVKMMVDFTTATERARDKFGAFGDVVVDRIASIEKANLQKAISRWTFDSDLRALQYEQNAQRLSSLPESQFAGFQRAVDKFEKSIDFLLADSKIDRQIKEADFYATKFNPNNPLSFVEYNRRGMNDDISELGLSIREAVEDIKKIQLETTNDVGIYGEGYLAQAIRSLIPDPAKLAKALNQPGGVGADAQFLLGQLNKSLPTIKEANRQKFLDQLQNLDNQNFARKFGVEQLDLINNSRKLSDKDKLFKRLDVYNSLGNDLDPRLRRDAVRDNLAAAGYKRRESDEAAKAAKETAAAAKQLKSIIKQLITGKGLKVDPGDALVTVKLESDDEEQTAQSQTVPTPTAHDTTAAYS